MKKAKENIMILCDGEEEYLYLMADFLRRQKNLPWQIKSYSSVERMLEEEKENAINLLLIAESQYSEAVKKLASQQVVVLNESGILRDVELHNINKYQQAEGVYRELLELYAQTAQTPFPTLGRGLRTRFIGIYSPVRRCMQTRFALTMGEMLAQKYNVLYLNFEHFAGNQELLAPESERDLADVLYFLMADRDRFWIHLQTVLRHRGKLDYVPPMKSGQNLLTVTAQEWLDFMKKLDELGEYAYVIMDLSECMQGLFDILRQCVRVYTITKKDRMAQSKILQYEQLLHIYAYQDVLDKTRKCTLPKIDRVLDTLEQFRYGEMAGYMETLLRELEG